MTGYKVRIMSPSEAGLCYDGLLFENEASVSQNEVGFFCHRGGHVVARVLCSCVLVFRFARRTCPSAEALRFSLCVEGALMLLIFASRQLFGL